MFKFWIICCVISSLFWLFIQGCYKIADKYSDQIDRFYKKHRIFAAIEPHLLFWLGAGIALLIVELFVP